MKVSVAMAVFNGEPYLAQQLSSVLSQLGPADELIVSDNGSTDGSVQQLRQAAAQDGRIRLLSCASKGVTANFNNALSACTGELVFLADQDDVWLPDKLRVVCAALSQPGVSAVVHGCTWVNEALQPLERQPAPFRRERIRPADILWRNQVQGCCLALRREVLQRALPIPEWVPMHDSYLGLMAARQGELRCLQQPLLLYRRHGSNAGDRTARQSLPVMLRDRWRLLRCLFR